MDNYKKIYAQVEKILAEDSLMKAQDKIDKDISKALELPSLEILKKDSSKAKNGIYKNNEKRSFTDIFPAEKEEKVEIIDEIPPEDSQKMSHIHSKKGHCHGHKHFCKKNQDIVSFDIPLFLRLLEYAKEDAKSDLDLHFVTENIILLSKKYPFLTMENYKDIIDIEETDDEEDDMEEIEVYDFEENEDGILEAKKKKKKARVPRRGYGFIWPLYPMHMRPPPPPPPPKPPKPDETPDDVSDAEEVSPETSDSSSTVTSSPAPAVGGDVGGVVSAVGGDAGGASVAAGAPASGVGAITEAEENESPIEIGKDVPISQEHRRKIEDMEKKDLAKLVATNYKKVLATPKDIVSDKLIEKINVKSVLGGPDQSMFIKFVNMKDVKENFAHFEIDEDSNFKISTKWNPSEHLFSSEETLKKFVYPDKKPEEITLEALWP